MDRIHLAQVPRDSRGQINYALIPSMVVRVMVAEEELSVLRRKLKRHYDSRDRLRVADDDLPDLEAHIVALKEQLTEWRGLLEEV